MKVVLLGAYPPPIGGVSIHIQRLAEYLLEQGYCVEVLDYPGTAGEGKPPYVVRLPRHSLGKLWFIRHYARQQSADTVVHFHVAAVGRFRWVAPLLFWSFRQQPKFITIHSGLFIGNLKKRLSRAYFRFLLDRCCHIIPVTQELGNYLLEIGIRPDRMTVIPAHITRNPQEAPPAELERAKAARRLVMTSGFPDPLYNFDVLIDVIPRLNGDKYHFVFVFYGQANPAYEAEILRRLAAFPNVSIFRDQPSDRFLSILKACDVYVRATVRDGDAITIREALDFGLTVFATDCVGRPENCLLFRHDDAASLYQLFADWQENGRMEQRAASASNARLLVDLYRAVACTPT